MSKINNLQYAIIFLTIGLFIVLIFQSLGNDLVVNRSNFMKSYFKYDYDYVKENLKTIYFNNYKIVYKIIDKNKPFLFYFSPVLYAEKIKRFLEVECNFIQIHYNNTFVKPKIIKKQYLKAFDFCLDQFNITKNVVLLGICSFTDLSLYVAHKRINVIKNLILESTMNTLLDTVNHLKNIRYIKFLLKDEYTINKKFNITKDILLINYKEEFICPIKDSLNKVKKIKNENNNIYLYFPKKYPKDKRIGHADAHYFEDYVDVLKKWINR
jgi:hypothetical protein